MANVAGQAVKNGKKRERTSFEDDMEFMPLSKRIQTINLNQNNSEHARMQDPVRPGNDKEMILRDLTFQDSHMSFQDCDSHVPMNQDYDEPSLATLYLGDGNESNESRLSLQMAERNGDFDQTTNQSIKYNPSMPMTENPHYYHQNQTLFYLYLERVHRNRQLPHPSCLQ